MMGRIFIIHWDKEEGREISDSLSALGFDVHHETEDGGRAFRTIRDTKPNVIVVYLTKRPTHGKRTAASVHNNTTLSNIPIFFVGGEKDKVNDFKEQFKGARFVEEDQLVGVLTEVLSGKWA